jgi:hypothetical protein
MNGNPDIKKVLLQLPQVRINRGYRKPAFGARADHQRTSVIDSKGLLLSIQRKKINLPFFIF